MSLTLHIFLCLPTPTSHLPTTINKLSLSKGLLPLSLLLTLPNNISLFKDLDSPTISPRTSSSTKSLILLHLEITPTLLPRMFEGTTTLPKILKLTTKGRVHRNLSECWTCITVSTSLHLLPTRIRLLQMHTSIRITLPWMVKELSTAMLTISTSHNRFVLIKFSIFCFWKIPLL